MTDHSEPYWCDEHDPPVKCYEWCPACAEWGEYEVKELKELVVDLLKQNTTPKAFYVTTKTKNLVIKEIGLDQFKDEARRGGFDVIHVMDDITGPIKEEIWL